MRVKTQSEKDKEFIKKTIESHVKFLTEKRDALKEFFVHSLDSKAVLDLLPTDSLVQEIYEERQKCFQSADKEYFNARNDFIKTLQRLAEQYPNFYIDQIGYRNDWPISCDLFENWYKEYRMGKI